MLKKLMLIVIMMVCCMGAFAIDLSDDRWTAVFINAKNNAIVKDVSEIIGPRSAATAWRGDTAQLYISSSDASDASAGTGARTVTIKGLATDYTDLTEVATLNGTTNATITGSFFRVNEFYVTTAGSGDKNAGDVYFYSGANTSGVPDVTTTTYAKIPVGKSVMNAAFYTVPLNKKLKIKNINIVTKSDSQESPLVTLKTKIDGGIISSKPFNNTVSTIFSENGYNIPATTDMYFEAQFNDFTGEAQIMLECYLYTPTAY